MTLKAIFRNTGVTILRVPLLWFFSVVFLITWNVTSMAPGLACLTLLLFPITVIAEAGQIRSVQLHYEGTPTSVSQVIRHSARRIGPLIVVLVVYLLLLYIILGILLVVARLLLQQFISWEMVNYLSPVAISFAYPFSAFALCALVISDLPLRSSLTMVFRVVQKNAIIILAIVSLLGVLRVSTSIILPTTTASPVIIVGYMLVLLILEGIQSAVYTFTYLSYTGVAH